MNPIVYFKATDRQGGPFTATFDQVSCQTPLEALTYAKEMIQHIKATEDCEGITFWASCVK